MKEGYDDAAHIALTHSFVISDIRIYGDSMIVQRKNYLGFEKYFSEK